MIPYNKKLVKNAQELRKNMTSEEKRLWYDFLKRFPVTVRRQHNIGSYIVDFYIADKKTVIEVDGRQHLSTENMALDAKRDADLAQWGITVLRYPNKNINENFTAIATDILDKLGMTFDDLKPL